MQLYQFRHSAFCEKVRLVIAAKGLAVDLVDVIPGLGQLELFRLSGQRQVPVLVDGGEVIADSTAIALHLEARHPEPALLPADPCERARALLLEDWADTSLATSARLALLQGASHDPALRSALLPQATPDPLRRLLEAVPVGVTAPLSELFSEAVSPRQSQQLRHNLEQLCRLVAAAPHLVGSQLSLADLAVVAQLSLLRFPASAGDALAGRGPAGLSDDPGLEPLFAWRDAILAGLGRG